jgi:hypothetical protein
MLGFLVKTQIFIMKVCSKCNIDKEDKEFQTYWHSTQQKFRIRKECRFCHNTQHNERRRLKRLESKLIQVSIRPEIVQPVQLESQPDLSTDKNYQQCRTCEQFKLKTEYYRYNNSGKKSYLDCRICINKKEVERSRIDRIKELEENGGSFQHKINPGEWIDEYQKEATYNILKAIGWKLNKDNGIWWKEGIKTSDGVFINVKSSKRLSFENYPSVISTPQKKETFDTAVAMRNKGKTYREISNKLNLSETTIHKWLNYEKY